MNFKSWNVWLRSLPLSLKWLVVLILIRPVVDMFYFLKDVSPLLSPLYIFGVLTPILILISIYSPRFPLKINSVIIDFTFGVWSSLVTFNIFITFFIDSSLDFFGEAVKYITPVLLFIYFRRFVRSKLDLIGILQTFVYSAIIPFTLLLYEIIFEPIAPEYLSESRGGGARIQGAYADIMNYAVYATAVLIIQGYFFLKSIRKKTFSYNKVIFLFFTLGISFATFYGIKQTSSWVVGFFILMLFLLFSLGSKKGILIIALFIPFFLVLSPRIYKDNIEPLVEKEYNVIEGEADISSSFNGRMRRWEKYFDIWSDMPLSSNLFGASISGNEKTPIMLGGGMHSDFVRVIFLTGIVGFLVYMTFYLFLFRRAFKAAAPERFLVIAAIGSTLLYSISTTPLLYSPYLYYTLPIFAYISLPKTILSK